MLAAGMREADSAGLQPQKHAVVGDLCVGSVGRGVSRASVYAIMQLGLDQTPDWTPETQLPERHDGENDKQAILDRLDMDICILMSTWKMEAQS